MKLITKRFTRIRILTVYLFILAILSPALLQAQAGMYRERSSGSSQQYFSQNSLEKLVAPIAIYPDPLLAQVLPASTYPLEIVQAARLIHSKKDFSKIDSQTWDPSVKAVAHYPSVLQMMNEKLDWTQELGQAVLTQQEEVMKAIQALRQQAKKVGNLKSNKKQIINEEEDYIEIVPYNPEIVYVPTYDPEIVYETRDDDYSDLISFGVGVAIGSFFNTEVYWPRHRIYYSDPDWWNRGWYDSHKHYRNGNYDQDRNNNNYDNHSRHNDNTNSWTHDNNRAAAPIKRNTYFMPPIPANSRTPRGSVLIPSNNRGPQDHGRNRGQDVRPPSSNNSNNPERKNWDNPKTSEPKNYDRAPAPVKFNNKGDAPQNHERNNPIPVKNTPPPTPRQENNIPPPVKRTPPPPSPRQENNNPPPPIKRAPPPSAPAKVEKSPEVKSAPAPKKEEAPAKKKEEDPAAKSPPPPPTPVNTKVKM